jgi:hypothetical protein
MFTIDPSGGALSAIGGSPLIYGAAGTNALAIQ